MTISEEEKQKRARTFQLVNAICFMDTGPPPKNMLEMQQKIINGDMTHEEARQQLIRKYTKNGNF